MIYLDHGATSFHKPPSVRAAMWQAMEQCANPGRGGYRAAMRAAETVYHCRETAAKIFDCLPEQVVFTANCTHGLNVAIHSCIGPGARVVISGFEHNGVTRPLHLLGAEVTVAGRKLFHPEDTLQAFENGLRKGADLAVVTHVSNVFGYILPVEQIGQLCRHYGVPLIVDAAQSAGVLDVSLRKIGADFIAMPGHKGLLGPQGTGILLCAGQTRPFMAGGTGSESENQDMPAFLPDRLEAGTLNVPGIAGLDAGMQAVRQMGTKKILRRQQEVAKECIAMLKNLGYRVFFGENQTGTISFVPEEDCEALAQRLARKGVAVRAGLHCAPLAHESAGTLETGTVRISFGYDAHRQQVEGLRRALL